MAFGQASGPPASHSQLRELADLLEAAGHADFRDARGPMGFTQRQASGKFTRDEADHFIATLHAAAHESAEAGESGETGESEPAVAPPATARPKPRPRTRSTASLDAFTDEQLAAELQQRGWIVMEP
jgi:hypothetical protein